LAEDEEDYTLYNQFFIPEVYIYVVTDRTNYQGGAIPP
jgi:hypothetical protein